MVVLLCMYIYLGIILEQYGCIDGIILQDIIIEREGAGGPPPEADPISAEEAGEGIIFGGGVLL